jgi:hypothetical protein
VADVENALEALLLQEVENSPLGQRLGLIRPDKVARVVGCHRRTLDREIERGRIRVFRIATRTFVPLDGALAWWAETQMRSRPCRTRTRTSDSKSAAGRPHRTNRIVGQSSASNQPERKVTSR